MKTINRILIVILLLVVLIGTPAQAAGYKYFPDVHDDASYADAVNLLYALDVITGYPDGTFRPDGLLTRAEFAVMVSRLLRFEEYQSRASASFRDVRTSHWAYPYVETAVKAGLVNGFGDGTFKPDDSLTYEQAIAVLVRAYDNNGLDLLRANDYEAKEAKALSSGGWPYGYINVANELEITDGIEIVIGQPITRSEVATLICNAFIFFDSDWDYELGRYLRYYMACGRVIMRYAFGADDTYIGGMKYTYDINNNMVRSEQDIVDSLIPTLYYVHEYNAHKRNIKTTVCWPDGAILNWFIYEYDANGTLVKTTAYNEDGTERNSSDPFFFLIKPWPWCA